MKKGLLLLLIVVMALIMAITIPLSGCKKSATAETTAAASATTEMAGTKGFEATISALSPNAVTISGDEKISVPDTGKPFKIGFSPFGLNNPYYIIMQDKIKAICEAYGGEVVVIDSFMDVQKQLDGIESLINQKVDGVIITSADSYGAIPGIEALNKAGIPVIACDNAIYGGDLTATFIANNYSAGSLSAQRMAERLNGKGNIIVYDWPSLECTRSRINALYNVLSGNPGIVILDQQKCGEVTTGHDITENELTKYGDKINAIFAINEPGIIGAMQAVEAAGLKDKIFGATVDGMMEGVDQMKKGMNIECIGEQFPEKQVRMATEMLISVIRGQQVPAEWKGKVCLISSNLITKADALAGKYDYKWEPISYTKPAK